MPLPPSGAESPLRLIDKSEKTRLASQPTRRIQDGCMLQVIQRKTREALRLIWSDSRILLRALGVARGCVRKMRAHWHKKRRQDNLSC